jgi:hypothetical protein
MGLATLTAPLALERQLAAPATTSKVDFLTALAFLAAPVLAALLGRLGLRLHRGSVHGLLGFCSDRLGRPFGGLGLAFGFEAIELGLLPQLFLAALVLGLAFGFPASRLFLGRHASLLLLADSLHLDLGLTHAPGWTLGLGFRCRLRCCGSLLLDRGRQLRLGSALLHGLDRGRLDLLQGCLRCGLRLGTLHVGALAAHLDRDVTARPALTRFQRAHRAALEGDLLRRGVLGAVAALQEGQQRLLLVLGHRLAFAGVRQAGLAHLLEQPIHRGANRFRQLFYRDF